MARFKGLTEFQKDLLEVAQREAPKEIERMMKNAGRKGAKMAKAESEARVNKRTGYYHSKWKAGKFFESADGSKIVRIINSAPHSHLLEYGHDKVVNPPRTDGKPGVKPGKGIGKVVGFTPGLKPLDIAMQQFEQKREFEKAISRGLDSALRRGKL